MRRSVVTETSRESRSRYVQAAAKRERHSLSSSLSPRIFRRKLGYVPPPEQIRHTIWYTSSNLDEFTYVAPSSPKFQQNMFPRRNSPSPTHVKTKLHHFNPQEVAQELCLMDSELLRKIHPQELEGGSWMKEQKALLAPNVLAMVKSSNEIAQLVPSEVLAETTPQARAKVISIFIKIASKCYHLKNFNSLKAVLAGLQCTPVFRLKKSWKEVQAKKRKKYAALSKLMSEEHNWSVYRIEIQSKLDDNIPCVPFLGVLLTSIVQQGSVHTAKLGGRRFSGVEDYTVMEAITVRNRLEKMRKISGNNRYSTFHPESIVSPSRKSSQRNYSMSDNADRLCFDIPVPDHHSILEEDGGSEEDESATGSPETSGFRLMAGEEKLPFEDSSSSQQSPSSEPSAHVAELQHQPTLSDIAFDLVEGEGRESHIYGDRCSQELGLPSFAANISAGSLALSSDSNTSEEGVATNHRQGDLKMGLGKPGGRSDSEDQVGHCSMNGLSLGTGSPINGETGGRNSPMLGTKCHVEDSDAKNGLMLDTDLESPVGETGSSNSPTLGTKSHVENSDAGNGLMLGAESPVGEIGGRNSPMLGTKSHVENSDAGNGLMLGTESPVGETGGRNSPTPGTESHTEDSDTKIDQASDTKSPGSRKAPRLSSETRIPSVTVDCTEEATTEENSEFKVYWDPGPSPSSAVKVEPLENPGGGATLVRPPFQRSVSERQVALSPPQMSSFLSMECLTELLQNPSNLSLIRTGSAQGLDKDLALSISSDEGLGLSDESSITTTPELNTPTLTSPAHFGGFGSGDGAVQDQEKDSDTAVGDIDARATTGDASTTALPSASQPEATGDSTLTRHSRISQELTVDDSTRKTSTDSIAAEEPERRRSRRRASKVLKFALARSDKSMHVPSLLERYQVCSLACCSNLPGSRLLRELITNAPRNTEGQNYKLSYDREPQ